MSRVRRSSFGGGETVTTAGSSAGTHTGGLDQKRRTELLAEARRKRVAWAEEARGVDEGVNGARRRRENEAAANGRKAESELERLFPSAVKFHDFLSGLAGDLEESPAGDLSAILQPFMVQDVDIGDDRPIPSHREGAAAYDVFLDKLKHPRAAEVVKSLQQFVAAFKARAEGPQNVLQLASPGPRGRARSSSAYEGVPVSGTLGPAKKEWRADVEAGVGANGRDRGDGRGEGAAGVTAATMSGMMHAFLGRVETQMRESAMWRRETPAQWEETRECLERIVMHKVFDQAHGLAADRRRDTAISERLHSLSFLTEEHLGIAPLVDREGLGSTWKDAEAELVKMSQMRCPGDMLKCIIRCTHMVGGLLTGSKEGDALPGADEFLPALIMLVKRANPPGIHSNLEFIQSFRDPAKLLSEAGYVLTQLVSAVCFLEEVDASVLSIAHGDFERGLKGFQENAREGLQAHQLEVKKQEEHARLLHTNSQHHQPNGATDTDATEKGTSGAGAGTSLTMEASAGVGTGGGSLASRAPGPAIMPQAKEPRKIFPAEVRAERLKGRLGAHVPFSTDGSSSGALERSSPNGSDPPLRQSPVPSSPLSASAWTGAPGARSSRSSRSESRQDRHEQQHQQRGVAGRSPAQQLRLEPSVGGLASQLRFVGCTAAELRMSELPALLAEHQQLARLCEELLAERGDGSGGPGLLRRRRI